MVIIHYPTVADSVPTADHLTIAAAIYSITGKVYNSFFMFEKLSAELCVETKQNETCQRNSTKGK